MAGYDGNLNDALNALDVNDGLVLDDSIRTQLSIIEKDYESVFSWDIQKLTGVNKNLTLNLIDKIRDKKQMAIAMAAKDDEFNFDRFYSQLVASYELYNSKNYRESYLEIESIVKFLETCKFNEYNEQYADAYHHIARASYAYIALTLQIDSEKLLKGVKNLKHFNEAEKSAIFGVKARIFMEYDKKGIVIALKFADQARTLHSIEPEWIFTWLIAKGKVRRSNELYKMPGDDEMKVAEIFCSIKSHPKFLMKASQLYKEAGQVNKLKNNYKESAKFFKLSSDIAKISFELANDDVNQLNSILLTCIECPNECFSKSMIENLVLKLSSVNNSCVDKVLGLYYLKYEKDYVKAKMYLSRGMAAGQFGSSLQLIIVECLLQSVEQFPFVETLKKMYNDFPDPNRRLIIILQILLYYTIIENNPDKIMKYLKLYLDEDIEDTYKKHNLIFARPLFNIGRYIKPHELLNNLSENVKKSVTNNYWDEEKKKTVVNTFDRFNKILQLNIEGSNFDDDKDKSWRKQRVDLSINKSNLCYQKKNESWRKKKDPRQ